MTATIESTSGEGGGPRPRGSVPALVLVGLALAWAYGRDLMDLGRLWLDDPDYSHGILVVPVALAVLWRRWPGPGEARPWRPSAWGWALLAAALAARFAFYEVGKMWLTTATLLPALAGLTLAYGGRPMLRRAWPAIAFLVFMLPIPNAVETRLSLPLQRMAARGSAELLRASGQWVLSEGNVLMIGDDPLEVAAACNGLAMLMSLAATVAATVLLVPMAAWKRVALLLGIVPIALVCNVLRIAATAWAYQRFTTEAGRAWVHDVAGWMMMPTALLLVGLGLWWLSWLVREEEAVTVSPVLAAMGSRPAAPAPAKPKPPAGDAPEL